ncbi:hypothetical protein AX14_006996, partial [Amanita brunnescens Koide BX004]
MPSDMISLLTLLGNQASSGLLIGVWNHILRLIMGVKVPIEQLCKRIITESALIGNYSDADMRKTFAEVLAQYEESSPHTFTPG